MSGFAASILEDYDHDANPELTEEELFTEVSEAEQLEQSLGQLYAAQRSIGNFGLTPTAQALLGITGLLSSTSSLTVGLEAFANDNRVAADKDLALEALGTKIKDTAAKWAGKVMRIIRQGGMAIINALTPLYDAVAGKVRAVAEKAGELLSDGVAYAKAHPYKTILIALGAVATVVGVVGMVNSAFPALGATNGVMKTFMGKLGAAYRSLRLPFGKIATTATVNGEVIIAEAQVAEAAAAEAGRIGVLGWTKSAVVAVRQQIGHLWLTLKTGVVNLGGKFISTFRKITSSPMLHPVEIGKKVAERTSSPVVGWVAQQVVVSQYMRILFKVIPNLFHLVGTVFRQAFHLIKETFTGLLGTKPATA